MKTIYKYAIEMRGGPQKVKLHAGAKILAVQAQFNEPMMWAEVTTALDSSGDAAVMEDRTVQLFATGSPMPDNPGNYIGTFQTDGGNYVFHLYEVV